MNIDDLERDLVTVYFPHGIIVGYLLKFVPEVGEASYQITFSAMGGSVAFGFFESSVEEIYTDDEGLSYKIRLSD